jgi:hypothetical protein
MFSQSGAACRRAAAERASAVPVRLVANTSIDAILSAVGREASAC